jgi:hypothetical protein
MKYITAVLGLLLIAGCAHTSPTPAPENIIGSWKGTIHDVDTGSYQDLAFKFVSDGPNVGGFMRNETAQGEWIPLENLRMKGDKINFTVSTNIPQGKINYKFKGRLVDSEFKLAAKAERPGASKNTPRVKGIPSFRYEGRSAEITESTRNEIDQVKPSNMDTSEVELIKGMLSGGEVTFNIQKVQ